jgi:uncharacterized protein YbaR (Trm112 family)
MMLVDPWLLSILRCPVCHEPVDEDAEASELVCTGCGERYPVEDGIPNMLPPGERDAG